MSPKSATLDEIERWMQAVLMQPGGVEEGLSSAGAVEHLRLSASELEEVISRSRAQTSAERLEIYVTAYRMRLMECLRAEFSVTQATVGDDVFDALVFGYLQQYPSRSYTLGELGARFPKFLADTPLHMHAAPAGSAECWGQFVIELARWERLVAEVFDGPGSESLPGIAVERLAGLQADDGLRLVGAPDLRLAVFTHPVHRYWRAMRAGLSASPPAAATTRLAVHRQAFVVCHHDLSERQYALLELLVGGSSVQDALGAVSARFPGRTGGAHGDLHAWFAEWARLGFFCDAERSQEP